MSILHIHNERLLLVAHNNYAAQDQAKAIKGRWSYLLPSSNMLCVLQKHKTRTYLDNSYVDKDFYYFYNKKGEFRAPSDTEKYR